MSENNRSYRLRTKVGVTKDSPIEDKYLTVKLDSEIDTIDIMSLKIRQENAYKFHAADYGVVVGRAIANGGFGVPNVKVSVFIAASQATKNDAIYNAIYPYERVTQKNTDNIRYNLLPDALDDDCYQVVGTFPNKRLVLDDNNYLEIYDEYYKFTTRTNNAGDYMIFGIPTGGQMLHFDVDLSDVGVLSQRPRDMIYKGYNINQFENANQFKKDDNLANLPQIISQDDSVFIYPFWGDEDENIIGITRHDIDINYKFEPTCVFIGSIVTDTNSNKISKKCVPTAEMGMMEELVTGPGTIEMIRKKQNGDIEQYNIQGTQLINDDGIWCYQIPMNLDYMITDEYGNLVPSEDPTKGIATRTSVRFRFSMDNLENDSLNSFRTKVLVPNNPQNDRYEPDYVFGSFTEEESFRDLLWNNVYTVKSFIPRFQKGNGNRSRRFSGIKQCNYHGQNNPIPYNNMRINLSFQFVITCLLVRLLIWLVGIYNSAITMLAQLLGKFPNLPVVKQIKNLIKWIDTWPGWIRFITKVAIAPLTILGELALLMERLVRSMSCIYIDGSMCEQLEGSWYFAPNCGKKSTAEKDPYNFLWLNMFARVEGKKMEQNDYSKLKGRNGGGMEDKQSIDSTNKDDMTEEENMVTIEFKDADGNTIVDASGNPVTKTGQYVISRGINYFVQCIEISLAMEFRVIQFDFYNDWINGMVYVPRWERSLKRKRKYFLFGKARTEIRACNDVYKKRFFERKNYLTEQCAVSYKARTTDNSIGTKVGCKDNKKYKCHKKKGRKQFKIFNDGGVVHEEQTASGLYAYYFRPCEYVTYKNSIKNRKVNLFATDLVLLGSLTECDLYGTPVFTNELVSSTYQIPSPLAHTDSTEEGFTYIGKAEEDELIYDKTYGLNGIFDFSESILDPQDDGSVTEESGIDWSYTGPGQGVEKKPKTYTPGGHFLGISCVNSESSIKSCVNLKRICEVNVWPSQRQEVFNGYNAEKDGTYLDLIPNGLIAKDDIGGGIFRKTFATMNQNGLKTRVNDNGLVVYDFTYMTPENFGGELRKYSKGNYNEANPIPDEAMNMYLAKVGDKNDYGETYEEDQEEAKELHLTPIRRSLDERDSDYMKFRLGLENDNNNAIQRKYLGNDDYGYYMPVYNNSYYFYFGLIPGSTALDEFYKLFFAECKQTMTAHDLRLNMAISYNNYCCGTKKCTNAFDAPLEISIFETRAKFLTPPDSLKIFSTAVPIKIIVDSEYVDTIKDAGEVNRVFIEYTGKTMDDGENIFSFGIGKHTIQVIDSQGRSATKLVEVVQQKVNFCPEVVGNDFTRDDYIINSTTSLITGSGLKPGMVRADLGGWFTFNWGEHDKCIECENCTRCMFSYKDIGGDCSAEREPHCIPASSIPSNLTLIFAGKSRLIKVGNWSDATIEGYDIFEKYSGTTQGTVVTSGGDYHIYAGEEGNYDLYILYTDGTNSTPYPILVQDNIYIGEPDAIDFDVFRTIVESEDDSPVTYRNPIIKIWYTNQSTWYNHLYDGDTQPELTDEQRWYVRKTSFYVLGQPLSRDEDINEYFPCEGKMLYINTYYPTTIGNVTVVPQDKILMHNQSKILFDPTGNIITGYTFSVTGKTGDGIVITAPQARYGGQFTFYIFYKPYFYQAIIWEGYSVLTGNPTPTAAYGHVNGTVFNGVVYDVPTGQTFGPTLFNDRPNIITITPSNIPNDFTNVRQTPFSYDAEDEFPFGNSVNSLQISEGSPETYESEYAPVEYRIEAPAIGNQNGYSVDFIMDITNRNNPIVKFTITFDDNEYETINWFWSANMPLSAVTNQQRAITWSTDDLRALYMSAAGLTGITIPSAETMSFDIDLQSTSCRLTNSGNGGQANDVSSGTLLLESEKRDSFRYNMDGTQDHLGFLKSRNFIRDDIQMNYSYLSNKLKVVFFFGCPAYTRGDLPLGKKDWNTMKKDGRKRSAAWERTRDHWEFAIRKIYVYIPYDKRTQFNRNFRNEFGLRHEQIIISYPGWDRDYDLINDLGYSFNYISSLDPEEDKTFLVTELTEAHPDNNDLYEPNTQFEDEFTDKIMEIYNSNKVMPNNKIGSQCTVTIVSTGLGDSSTGHNNILDSAKLTFKGDFWVIEHSASSDEEDDD